MRDRRATTAQPLPKESWLFDWGQFVVWLSDADWNVASQQRRSRMEDLSVSSDGFTLASERCHGFPFFCFFLILLGCEAYSSLQSAAKRHNLTPSDEVRQRLVADSRVRVTKCSLCTVQRNNQLVCLFLL